jgi:hypothetical protein
MKPHHHPEAAIIEAIGVPALVKRFNASFQKVNHWKLKGIPEGYRAIISEMAKAIDCPLPADFLEPRPFRNRRRAA